MITVNSGLFHFFCLLPAKRFSLAQIFSELPPKCETNIARRLISFTNFNAQSLYSLTICMLHYNPRHVSSIDMPIFGRKNCIITAFGNVTLCTAVYREWRYQMLW